ncbi:DUF5957 family protein [Paenibacillus arenilitoris]|nr:DUF5957 family protein [Paenibacillus arenilitoris]
MLLAALIGLALGAIAGLVLSSLIGIVSYLTFDRPVGIKYLPIYFGAAGAIAGLSFERRRARG